MITTIFLQMLFASFISSFHETRKEEIILKIRNAYQNLKTYSQEGSFRGGYEDDDGKLRVMFSGKHTLFIDKRNNKLRMDLSTVYGYDKMDTTQMNKIISQNVSSGLDIYVGGTKRNDTQYNILTNINREAFTTFFIFPELNVFRRRMLPDSIKTVVTEEKIGGIHCYKLTRKYQLPININEIEKSEEYNKKILDSVGVGHIFDILPKQLRDQAREKEDTYWFRKKDLMMIKAIEITLEPTTHDIMKHIYEWEINPTANPVLPADTFQ